MDTRTVVQTFLQSMAAGDSEAIKGLFAERVDWRLDWPDGEHPAVPWIRPRFTAEDAAAHFREISDHHVPEKAASEIHRILVDGPDAVVLATIVQTARATGREYTAMCAVHLTVENGLITRYHVYEDSLTVSSALTPWPDFGPASKGFA
ncbi:MULTISPECIES: nuclear transport factor 2 family protein [Thermomonosporaceae]|uniref:nuclear transport factor 2 family protein n=1 Tax=Thermomonosporaceae TaxID=2012 RepID=UPI00255B0886|nr:MULTISPECIES: nuclear transport factor 2 family protein [Thermomonosporaceae]MDL4774929.1 nuclear transport factor 2 family protein [Actinomadura xylanilytica]